MRRTLGRLIAETAQIDSSYIMAYRCTGGERGAKANAIRVSRGGRKNRNRAIWYDEKRY